MNFLSWFKTSDVYDPDRLAQDQEAIRKYYMKYGYADFRITNTDVAYQSRPGRATSSPSRSTKARSTTSPASTVTSRIAEGRQRVARTDSSRCTPATSTTRAAVDETVDCDHARTGAAGLRLLRRAAARRARRSDAPDRARLHRRRRPEGLHRAHRRRRQHAHARLRDPPRVRHRRRRPLQPCDDRTAANAA